MSNSLHVVDGEASESDSDIEVGKSPDVSSCAKTFVIPGEAPESDDERKLTSPTGDEIDSPLHTSTYSTSPAPMNMTHSSLLHQKLWESNVSLRASLEGLVKHTTDICVDKLSRSDKTLLLVQESMRATNANLALSLTRLKQLHTELDKANCASALPTVKRK